jgi:hypothetical protein
LISPSNGATSIINSATLEWQISTSATSYEFAYDTLSNFSTAVIGNTSSTNEIITGLNNNNKTYYWKVRAINGTSIYSGWSVVWSFETGTTVGTEEITENFRVYPNPFSEYINLQIEDETGVTIFIYNSNGQIVHSESIERGIHIIFLSHLPSGIYQMGISGKNGTRFVKLLKP